VIDPLVIALTFAAIFVVELPDKTFIATLVLSTKYRPGFVWIGVGLAFFCQVLIAVALGKAAALLPTAWVQAAAAAMFLVGALLLLREARGQDQHDDDDYAAKAGERGATDAHPLRVVLASFLVLFAAEWGDLSQLLTLSLVAKYDAPISVFLGSWGALLTVSGLAVLAGRMLLRRIPVHVLHYVGAGVCLVLAGLTVGELVS
jgi:putative Ca2+/H+ antiporter (TMEM165/GDT1 family)